MRSFFNDKNYRQRRNGLFQPVKRTIVKDKAGKSAGPKIVIPKGKRTGGNNMFGIFKDLDVKHGGFFAAGILFGTAGIKLLASRDAKNVYTGVTAAVLRAKDSVMKTATVIQENAEDIYEEAKAINGDRATQEFDDFDELPEEGADFGQEADFEETPAE